MTTKLSDVQADFRGRGLMEVYNTEDIVTYLTLAHPTQVKEILANAIPILVEHGMRDAIIKYTLECYDEIRELEVEDKIREVIVEECADALRFQERMEAQEDMRERVRREFEGGRRIVDD